MEEWSISDIAFDPEQGISITHVRNLIDEEYEDLLSAHQNLTSWIGRTTFSILVENYRAFTSIVQEIQDQVITKGESPTEPLRIRIATAIVNYLTSMKMFLDHSEVDLKRRDREDGGNRFKNWQLQCKAEYDDYFAYRFLYRFRNYILHIGLPLSALQLSSSLDRDGHPAGSVLLGESPASLVSSFDSWSTVRAELKALNAPIDLSEQISISMSCLTRISNALLKEDIPEIVTSLAVVNRIVGDLAQYTGSPIVTQIKGDPARPQLEIVHLDVARIQRAQDMAEASEQST